MPRKAATKTRKASSGVFKVPRLANPVFGDPVALKKVTDRISSNPKEARGFLLKAGIITKSGKLSPNYGGGK